MVEKIQFFEKNKQKKPLQTLIIEMDYNDKNYRKGIGRKANVLQQ